MGKTGAERLRESRERKKQKKREYNARFYVKNKDKILEDRKEERRKKRPRIVVEQERESKAPKPNWRLYKAKQRARKKAEKEKTLQMFLFHLMLSEEHFLTEPLENELSTVREQIFQVVQEKKLLSLLLLWKVPQHSMLSRAWDISSRQKTICSFGGC